MYAGGAAALTGSPMMLALSQTAWTAPYALPSAGQVVALTAPGGNTMRQVATAANGWGDYGWSVALAAPIYNGNGFGAFAEDYSTAGAMVIAGSGGHHAGGIWGGFIFDFTSGQWISKANANGKTETFGDPDDTAVDWSTGELIDKTGLIGQLPIPSHGYIWPFCPPKAIGGGTKGYYIKPCVVAGSDAGYDAGRSFQFDLDTGLWTYASDNNIDFDGQYLKPYTDNGGVWDPVAKRYYTTKGAYLGNLRYLEKTATAWTWRKTRCPNVRYAKLFTLFVHERNLVIGYTDATWQKIDLDNIGAGATYIAMANSSLAAGFYQRWHQYPVDGCWYTLKGLANRAEITSWPSDGSPIATLARDQFLLKLDPTTWTISQVPIEGGILALWESRYTATHPHGNAFIYVPKLQCFAWFPRHDGPVQLIKPPGGGTVADTQPPTVPANLRVVAATTSSVTWAWDASTDNGGGSVAGYKSALFDAAGVSMGSAVNVGNVLSHTASGLTAGTTYQLRVSAYDDAVPGNESQFCTAVAGATSGGTAIDTEPPSVPTNVRPVSSTATSITWAWDSSTDQGGGTVAGYKVALHDHNDAPIGGAVDVGNVLTYAASGLSSGTTYKLRVRAYDNAVPPNESGFTAGVEGTTSAAPDTLPPSVPATLRVKSVTSSSIEWTWSASTDAGGGVVAGYRVALYDGSGVPIGGAVDIGNVLTYTASGLTANTAYRLRVGAYDNAVPANESALCEPVTGMTAAPADTQPPTVPSGLTLATKTTTSLGWAWNASVDQGGGQVAGYKVALYDANNVQLGDLIDVGNVLAYVAGGLSANTTYKLRVSAYDDATPANHSSLCTAVAGVTKKKDPAKSA